MPLTLQPGFLIAAFPCDRSDALIASSRSLRHGWMACARRVCGRMSFLNRPMAKARIQPPFEAEGLPLLLKKIVEKEAALPSKACEPT